MDTQLHPPPPIESPPDRRDWDALYTAWLPRVYNFFRYRVGDDPLAEDLTATTFIKAWRSRADYDPARGAISTWLFAIARRVAADHFRGQRPSLPLDEAHPQSEDDGVEVVVERRVERDHLTHLLLALPAREREIIALKYGAEMTNRAIAAVTGLSESNVGTILHRTVHVLREQWDSQS
jgi:RNA polymerase sigma-70 factor (ECF subfamily)